MRRGVCPLPNRILRYLAVPVIVSLFGFGSAFAQSGDNHAQDQGKQGAAAPDANKENERKTAEFAEATAVISGPAGNPECVWLGRRVVRLMWVDDLDTAFRHLDLYDRFGCPGGHIQATFRCLTRFGAQIDDKVPRSLDTRIHACWINPAAQPQTAAAAAPATSGSSAPASPPAQGGGQAGNQPPTPAPAASPAPATSPSPAAK